MTNKEIRRRAWALCKENFWTILGASFLISLLSTLSMNLAYLLGDSLLSSMVMIALSVLSTILTLGMVRFILDIWNGQPTSLSVLFSQRRRFWTHCLSSILVSLIVAGITIAAFIPVVVCNAISDVLGGILAVIVTIAASVLMIWMAFRYEMTTACIVMEPALGATDCMRAAWRASKGNVGRLFCNGFVLNLPMLLAQALLIGYQTFLTTNGQVLNGFGSIVLSVASTLISALLTGYIALGTYALHEQLLNEYRRKNFPQSAADLWNDAPVSHSLTPEELGLGDPIELPAAEEDSDKI